MNTKRITYLAATLALATAAASCEHEEIYEPLEFSVRLAPTNTYRTGDPVVFNFSGNADFITVWTGDTGHEYKHRNRTKVDIADIESCELEIEISQQYGTLNNLDLFAGNKFAGLNIKGVTDDLPSYSYTYTEPGTYTVTFIVAGGNYQGQSAPAPYEVTFTVIDPIE